jgi:hypothetical protein
MSRNSDEARRAKDDLARLCAMKTQVDELRSKALKGDAESATALIGRLPNRYWVEEVSENPLYGMAQEPLPV